MEFSPRDDVLPALKASGKRPVGEDIRWVILEEERRISSEETSDI